MIDVAVTAVKVGDPIVPTIGLEAVPPVYVFNPGWTYVEAFAMMNPRSVPPE